MAQPEARVSELEPSTGDGREVKKRKLRKGTQSCWECKRRKSKCSFAKSTATGAICDGCYSRGTRCVGQEFAEDPASNRQQLGYRLGRVERLLASRLNEDSADVGIGTDISVKQDEHNDAVGSSKTARGSSRALAAVGVPGSIHQNNTLSPFCAVLTASYPSSQDLVNGLLTAWPSESDLENILSTSTGSSGLFHGIIFAPYSQFLNQPLPSPRELLQLPREGSHPALVARKLLTLGSFLQSFNPAATEEIAGRLSVNKHDLMSRAVETAVHLVTSNDELIDSVEGVECIMMESMYHNNAGNLRRAYLSMRRALVISQMIGLDQAASSSSSRLRFLEPDTRSRISPPHMWFRIIQSDGYLSLMLGLPKGWHDDDFAAPSILEKCTPMERMERLLTLAGGQVVQRKHFVTEIGDIEVTQKIDRLLLDAAASLPPTWWVPPQLTKSDDDVETLQNTLRTMNQMAHYHLLQRLHLPYLLVSSTARAYDYSKLTAITASRELLSRFLAFRSFWPMTGCFCRGVDFLAFVSSTALCLGHIKAKMHADDENNILRSVSHQRLGDRGMMEDLLRIMEQIESVAPTDKIAARIAKILRYLLAVEDEVAAGGTYQTQTSPDDEREDLQCDGKMDGTGNVLTLSIPHIGTIKLERGDTGIFTSAIGGDDGGASPRQNGETTIVSSSHTEDLEHSTHSGIFTRNFAEEDGNQGGQWFVQEAESEGWDLEGVDIAFFDTLFPIPTLANGQAK